MLEREQQAGLEKCVVLCAATAPAQVIPANNYAISLQREHPEQVIAFGTVHPAYENWENELARIKAAGIRGIKLHPDFQSFWLDDPRLLPIFETAQKDFVFEIHIGDKTTPDKNTSCTYKLASIMRQFPDMRVIAAHFGGYRMWSHALEVFSGSTFENLWFDTSSTTPFATPELAHKLLNTFPRERILFGTDWPLYDPVEELQRLQTLGGLSDSEMEVIMSNASALLAPNSVPTKNQRDH